jgi:hypothetical protein
MLSCYDGGLYKDHGEAGKAFDPNHLGQVRDL